MSKHIGRNITDAGDAGFEKREMDLVDLEDLRLGFSNKQHSPGNRADGYMIGTMDKAHKMEEGEDAGGISDQTDESIRNAAAEMFANKMKKAVSAKLMNKKTNLKLKGQKNIVRQVANMINLEADYLNAIMSGQSADTPSLQKNKAIIDAEAKKLDRMLGSSDLWPFK